GSVCIPRRATERIIDPTPGCWAVRVIAVSCNRATAQGQVAGKELPKVDRPIGSRSHIGGWRVPNDTVRKYLPPSFKAEKEKSVLSYLGNRPAERPAELMLVMALAGKTLSVELESVGIQNVMAPEIESRAMKILRPVLYDRIDCATTRAPVLRVVGVCHDLKFMNGVHIRCDFPLAGVSAGLLRDRRAIQRELVVET